jgi:hypothetical protein
MNEIWFEVEFDDNDSKIYRSEELPAQYYTEEECYIESILLFHSKVNYDNLKDLPLEELQDLADYLEIEVNVSEDVE